MRRFSREIVLKALYSEEFNCEKGNKLLVGLMLKSRLNERDKEFIKKLYQKTRERKKECDSFIKDKLKNWKIERLSKIELNILRISITEMEEFPETPILVIINEAVEIAKKYGSSNSGKFVNGILDAFARGKGLL